ncbi:hypothetical protein EDC01DRAFT_634692 [Geopyxis carbonaria]|nr:hypothetical protein EDC01DRAFT_634692 [Geopyxis carbonaria]
MPLGTYTHCDPGAVSTAMNSSLICIATEFRVGSELRLLSTYFCLPIINMSEQIPNVPEYTRSALKRICRSASSLNKFHEPEEWSNANGELLRHDFHVVQGECKSEVSVHYGQDPARRVG